MVGGQRRERLIYGVIVGLALALSASWATASPRQQASSAVNLVSIQMVTARVGWGAIQTAFLHTTDGGHHWRNVTPHISWGKGYSIGYTGLDVIDGQTAWLAVPNRSRSPKPATSASIFHTTNGGQTWQRLPPLQLVQFGVGMQLQFIDAVQGWLVVIRAAGMSQLNFAIFRTGDGGLHWSEVLSESSPAGAGPAPKIGGGLPTCDCNQSYTFVTPEVAWAGACTPCLFGSGQPILFRTGNGGHTWRPYPLILPRGIRPGAAATEAPTFFSNRVAVLPVFLFLPHGGYRFDAYHTADGGRTWHGTTPFRVQVFDEPVHFVDPLHGFLLDGRTLYRTTNGGRSWQAIRTSLSRENLSGLDFVTATTGFALETIGTSSRTRLLETTDAGDAWGPVSVQLQ